MPSFKLTTVAPEITQAAGRLLSDYLFPADLILLKGSIGSGKTTFVQGVAAGLGVPPEIPITSPSFTIVNRYQGRLPIYHADLYRLDIHTRWEDLELEEIIHHDGVTLVEWPEIASSQLSDPIMTVHFIWDMSSLTGRTISFTTDSERFGGFLKAVVNVNSGN